MEETQNYLNQILKKRLGSVINNNTYSKTPGGLTRIPQKQEQIGTMPSVFRKKHETTYNPNSPNYEKNANYSSVYQSSKNLNSKSLTRGQQDQFEENDEKELRRGESQRVQYALISKRIVSKQSDNFIGPTVDVTQYKKPTGSIKKQQLNDRIPGQERRKNKNQDVSRQQQQQYSEKSGMSYNSQKQAVYEKPQKTELEPKPRQGCVQTVCESVRGKKKRRIFKDGQQK